LHRLKCLAVYSQRERFAFRHLRVREFLPVTPDQV
jgi:hypothetical protein